VEDEKNEGNKNENVSNDMWQNLEG